MVGTPDAAAELMELGKAEAVGAVDDDGVRRGYVDTALDDGGAHQDVEALVIEVEHHALELALRHLAVGDAHPRIRQQLRELPCHALDAVHVVVQEVDLAAAVELTQAGLLDQGVVPLADEGLYRQPPCRWRGDNGQVPHARQGHVQGARDRRRGEGENVDAGAQALELLLLAHAEAVLLVEDHQPEVVIAHRGLEQLVGADDDVHLAGGEIGEHGVLLLLRAETREQLDTHGPVGETVAEVLVVLLGEEGGGHHHRHLMPLLDANEGRAHRDLGLAEADIATHDPVHRLFRGEVVDHGRDRALLVRGLLEGKLLGETPVILRIVVIGVAAAGGAPGVDIEELGGDIAGTLRGLAPGAVPLLAAEPVERGVLGIQSRVARDQVQRGHRDVELVPAGVLQGEELGVHATDVERLQPDIAADAVILVDHRRTDTEIGEVADDRVRVPLRTLASAPLAGPLGEQRRLRDQGDPRLRQAEAALQRTGGDRAGGISGHERRPVRDRRHAQVGLLQALHEALPPARGLGEEQHAPRLIGEQRLQRRQRPGRRRLGAQVRQSRHRVTDAAAVRPLRRLLVQIDLGQGVEPLAQLVRAQVKRLRRQQRALAVVATLLVTLADLRPVAVQGLVQPGHPDRDAALGEVIEQRRRLLEEQRQVVLHAVGQVAFADLPVDHAVGGIAGETGAPVASKAPDTLLAGGELPRRQQRHLGHTLAAALGLRIEAPDGLDLVVEEVHAQRAVRAHREEIEYRAAHRELAVLHDLGDAAVARPLQALAHRLQREPVPLREEERGGLQEARRRDALHQRRPRHDEHAAAHRG